MAGEARFVDRALHILGARSIVVIDAATRMPALFRSASVDAADAADAADQLAGAADPVVDMVEAAVAMIGLLGGASAMEDVVVVTDTAFYLLRNADSDVGKALVVLLILDRTVANLAMARRDLRDLVVGGIPEAAGEHTAEPVPTRPVPEPASAASVSATEPQSLVRPESGDRPARRRKPSGTSGTSGTSVRSTGVLPHRTSTLVFDSVEDRTRAGPPEIPPMPSWIARFRNQAFVADVDTLRQVADGLRRL